MEYPDSVVANFLTRVRSIPAETDEPTWASRRRAILQVDGWTRRVLGVAVLAMHATILSFVLTSSIWLVRPLSAKTAYRSLFRDLREAGWGLERRASIAHALFAVRNRAVGQSAIRLYERTMQSRISRQSLGWG